MKIKGKKKEIIKLRLTMDELKLLYDGIGETSINGLVKSGMTEEQAHVMHNIYDAISEGGFFG